MDWADPDFEWLLDEVPTCTGAELAAALCPDLTDADRRAAAEALGDRDLVTATVRMILDDVADLLAATDAELDACASRIAAGESFKDVFESIPRRPGCAAGFFTDWEYVTGRFDAVESALERIAITPAGQVSHVLAWDKETDVHGAPVAVEYVSQVCPRVTLAGGREAILLPPRVAGLRTFAPVRDGGVAMSRSAVPSSTYLQVTGLSEVQLRAVAGLGVPLLAGPTSRQVSLSRRPAEPRIVV